MKLFAPSDVLKPDARNFGQHFLRPLLTRMSMEALASAVFRFKCFFGTGHLQFGPDDERAEERQIGALFGMQEVSELRLHLLRTALDHDSRVLPQAAVAVAHEDAMLGDGFLGLPHTVEALRGRRRRRDDIHRGRASRPQVAKMPLLPSMLTSWKSDVVGAMKWMRDIPARIAVWTAADIECDLPAPRPPRNSQHHDRSGGGSCASRAAKIQSSAASSPSPRISSSASSGVISLMSWRNWCMRLTSCKKRSAIAVVLFMTSPSVTRSFLPPILSTSARIFSVVSNTWRSSAA